MPLIQTTVDPTAQTCEILRSSATGTYNQMVSVLENCWQVVWQNPFGLTPQQVLTAMGTANVAACTTRLPIAFPLPTAGVSANPAQLQWTGAQIPSTETWTGFSIWTAATGGTFMQSTPLSSSFVANAGQAVDIHAGAITMTWAEAS